MKWQADFVMVQKKPLHLYLNLSDLENSDDETDEVYIPPELENESDCEEVPDESYSCQSIDQNKDNKNDNDENSNTEKLSDGQNGDKSNDSSTDDSLAEKMSEPKIKKKHPDHKWRWRAKEPPAGNTDFGVINSAVLQSIFMKCVRLIFSCRAIKSVQCTRAR